MKSTYLVGLIVFNLALARPIAHEDMDMHKPTMSDSEKSNASVTHSNMTDTDIEPSPYPTHSHMSMPILEDPNLEPQQRLFWEQYNTTTFISASAPNKPFLYIHIILTCVSWIFVYPISVMLSVENSSFYLLVQTLHTGLSIFALFCLAIFGATCPPELYPNNAYSRMSVAMFFILVIHWVSAVIKAAANWAISSTQSPIDGSDYILANLNNNSNTDAASSSSSSDDRYRDERPSQDSGHGHANENNQAYNDQHLRDDVLNEEQEEQDNFDISDEEENDYLVKELPKQRFESKIQNTFITKLMNNKKISNLVMNFKLLADIVYMILNRPLLVLGFAYLVLGIATQYRMGIAHEVFGLAAHLIKGGIFFLFGLVTLGRYLGAFADVGMAWNLKPGSKYDPAVHENVKKVNKSRLKYKSNNNRNATNDNIVYRILSRIQIPSMEVVESGLIFIYGISNVFLEHLGNEDGAWSHKDLQHVSIAFMFIGGGLGGLIVESKFVKKLLSKAARKYSNGNISQIGDQTDYYRGGFSYNPFPAFIVFWTGVLMSQHQQELQLSTQIHMQWGYLFCVGAMFRLFTYIMIYVSVPKSTLPTRPFTELLTSFCLICGGLVFMQSNSETVYAMLYRGLDSMFTLNVSVGVTALIMCWEMCVMMIKGWAGRRN